MRNLSFSMRLMSLMRLGRTLNAGSTIEDLPAPSWDNYALEPGDATVRTDMEVGTARQRRRTTTPPDMFKVTWDFNDTQMAQFREWFRSDTGASNGAAWFSITLASGDTGLTQRECRFVGSFKAILIPVMHWQVTAQLEARRA
jgi:hypothetical protein